jgi:hypothetical protein
MRAGVCGFAVLLVSGVAAAQTGGLEPDWAVRKDLASLAENIQRIKPILEQVKPQNWQGAPAAYVDQGKRVGAEIDYLITSTKLLAAQPTRITVALVAYFRMQSVDLMLRSYAEGIRKYQNPALAELLQGTLASAAADREKLRQYIMDLAAEKEQELRVMDEEAQRCRGMLSRQPRSASRAAERPQKEEHK